LLFGRHTSFSAENVRDPASQPSCSGLDKIATHSLVHPLGLEPRTLEV
jgi:hypothetical protein